MKRDIAVAIGYKSGEIAPTVMAKGFGIVARNIIKTAEDNNITINKNESLSKILSSIPVGKLIPEETYETMAEILAFLYHVDNNNEK